MCGWRGRRDAVGGQCGAYARHLPRGLGAACPGALPALARRRLVAGYVPGLAVTACASHAASFARREHRRSWLCSCCDLAPSGEQTSTWAGRIRDPWPLCLAKALSRQAMPHEGIALPGCMVVAWRFFHIRRLCLYVPAWHLSGTYRPPAGLLRPRDAVHLYASALIQYLFHAKLPLVVAHVNEATQSEPFNPIKPQQAPYEPRQGEGSMRYFQKCCREAPCAHFMLAVLLQE